MATGTIFDLGSKSTLNPLSTAINAAREKWFTAANPDYNALDPAQRKAFGESGAEWLKTPEYKATVNQFAKDNPNFDWYGTPGASGQVTSVLEGYNPSNIKAYIAGDKSLGTLAGMSKTINLGAPVPGSSGGPGAPGGQVPPYLLDQAANNLGAQARGEMPANLQEDLARQAAEYGVGGGVIGSQFGGYAGLKNYRDVALQRQDEATKLLAGDFLTPAQKQDFDLKNKQIQADIAQAKAANNQQALALAEQKRANLAAEANRIQNTEIEKQRAQTEANTQLEKISLENKRFLEELNQKYASSGPGTGKGYNDYYTDFSGGGAGKKVMLRNQ